MKMDLLKQKFLQVTGVSLDLLDEHPERMEAVFAVHGKGAPGRHRSAAGRGYPFGDREGIDAKEKDRENLEILAKW